MATKTLTVTLTPDEAKWCIKGYTGWLASGDTVTLETGNYTIGFSYIESYLTPDDIEYTLSENDSKSYTYTLLAWLDTWSPPISICLFRGQVIAGGCLEVHEAYSTDPSSCRLVRWSEIGAFRFLGAGANPKKNEAGEWYLPGSNDEMVMRVLPLENAVVVYGAFSITALIPVSDPAPTFKIQELVKGVGIANPLAVGGYDKQHVCVDRQGNLRIITPGDVKQSVSAKILGFQEFFAPMQESVDFATGEGIISVVYNPDEEEYYIGNGEKSYLLNVDGVSEIGEAITSYVNLTNTRLAFTYPDWYTASAFGGVHSLSTTLSIQTDVVDFGSQAIKTIESIEVEADLPSGALLEAMVEWRNDRGGSFYSTTWKRCSPSGFVALLVSGRDLRINLRCDKIDGFMLNNIRVNWKLSDKHAVRGAYLDASSTTARSGQ